MNNDDKLLMISIGYAQKNAKLISDNIKNRKSSEQYITKVSIVSNEFTHTHEDNIDIYQILTDLKFSITCYPNEILQFYFFKYKHTLEFSEARNNAYLHLFRGDTLGDNIINLCNFTLTYDKLMKKYDQMRLSWMVPQFTSDNFKCNHYDEILTILQQTILPTELCLLILKFLQKQIHFTINCHYSISRLREIYIFLCNPCLIIQ